MKLIIQLIKKLSLHLFLGMVFFNSAFAEILDLGNGLKINLPNNFSYYQQTFEESNKENNLQQTQEELETSNKTMAELGFNLDSKTTHMALGLDWFIPEMESLSKTGTYSDKAMKEIQPVVKKCQRKKTDEAFMKCAGVRMFKHFKLLPWFAVMGATDPSDFFSDLDLDFSATELTKSEKKERDKYIKEFEISAEINDTLGVMKAKMKPKIIIDDQGLWQIKYKGRMNMMGAVFKSSFYTMQVNNRVVVLFTFCDGKSCKNTDQQVAKILAPSFKMHSKKQSFKLDDKDDMLKLMATKNGQNFFKLAEHIMTNLQY